MFIQIFHGAISLSSNVIFVIREWYSINNKTLELFIEKIRIRFMILVLFEDILIVFIIGFIHVVYKGILYID